jgi:hypothetical protein
MNKAKSKNPAPESILIGLDWAKAKHDYCLLTSEGNYEFGQVKQDDAKLRHLLDDLIGRFPGQRLSICREAGREPLLWRS